MVKQKQLGFTLAELLIALTILGVIATFTIPKILTAQQDQKRKAIFQETISALSAIESNGVTQGTLTKNTINSTYTLTYLNAAKVCNNNASTEGCWVNTSWVSEENEPGAILHNGASVAGLRSTVGGYDKILIDWNGADGPNTEGSDRIYLGMCWDTADAAYAANCSRPSQQGYLEVGINAAAASKTLWNWIYQ